MQHDIETGKLHLDAEELADYGVESSPVDDAAALIMIRTARRLAYQWSTEIQERIFGAPDIEAAASSEQGQAELEREERLRANVVLLSEVVELVTQRDRSN